MLDGDGQVHGPVKGVAIVSTWVCRDYVVDHFNSMSNPAAFNSEPVTNRYHHTENSPPNSSKERSRYINIYLVLVPSCEQYDFSIPVSSAYLLFVNRIFIHQLRLSGEGMQTLLSGLEDAIAIDYHYRYQNSHIARCCNIIVKWV